MLYYTCIILWMLAYIMGLNAGSQRLHVRIIFGITATTREPRHQASPLFNPINDFAALYHRADFVVF